MISLPSSASAKQPPCHAESDSRPENKFNTKPNTSSAKSTGNLAVILPIPFAADHLYHYI